MAKPMQPDNTLNLAAHALLLGRETVLNEAVLDILHQRGAVEDDGRQVDRFKLVAVMDEVISLAIRIKSARARMVSGSIGTTDRGGMS